MNDEAHSEKLSKYILKRCKKDDTTLIRNSIIAKSCPSSLRDKRIFNECI